MNLDPRRRRRAAASTSIAAGMALLAVLAPLAVGGCRRASPAASSRGGAAASAAFRRGFDDDPAGIELGPGWYRPEPIWGAGSREVRGVAWASKLAEVYFAVPPFADAELAGRCLPLIYPEAPPQAVDATLNGHFLGRFPIEKEWGELRIPLPAAALTSPINTLKLLAAHAAQPSKLGLGGDVRALSVLYDTLAVVPRGEAIDGGGEAAAATGAPPPAPRRPIAGRPDVFIYLIDTLRADSVGAYGSPLAATPRIDAFSRDAALFAETRSAASWTLPAVFSILTGRYPFHHGVHLPGDRLPETSEPWLPTLFGRAGYETLGISQWLLGGDGYGIQRGFDTFFLNVYENGKMSSADARWFLEQNLRRPLHPARPLFAFLHTVDPHAIYAPRGADRAFAAARPGRLADDLYNPQIFIARNLHDPRDVAHLRGLYEGEVKAADRQFGAFLDLLRSAGLYDESLIVLVADHGEEFDEHGSFDHGRTLFEELLRVPMMVKLPRALGIAPRRVTAPVSTVDLAPTLVEAIGRAGVSGAPGVPGFDGESLLAALRAPDRPPRALAAETRVEASLESGAVDLQAVTVGSLKCIGDAAGKDQFGRPVAPVRAFDLERDPAERRPLAPTSREHNRCAEELARLAARARAEAPATVHQAIPSEDTARLRALGYIR